MGEILVKESNIWYLERKEFEKDITSLEIQKVEIYRLEEVEKWLLQRPQI